MRSMRPSQRMRLRRSFFLALLISLFCLLTTICAWGKDVPINVGKQKLKTPSRVIKGTKYLPIEKTCSALGMTVRKDGDKWAIDGSYRGNIRVGGRRSTLIEYKKVVYAPLSFWTKDLGLEIQEKGDTIYVMNRIVEVKKMPEGILVITAAPIDVKDFTIEDPSRFVYDIPNLAMGDFEKEKKFAFEDCPFSSIRLGQMAVFPHTGRVVVDAGMDSSFKPVYSIQGTGKNALWVGRAAYAEKVAKKEEKPVEKPKDGTVEIKVDPNGTVTMSGLKYEKATLTHLFDKAPFRAVCDLSGCKIPFKDEQEYKGYGQVERVRLAQNEDNVARLVVELKAPIMMKIAMTGDTGIVLSPLQSSFKNGFKVLIDPGHGGNDPGAQVTKSEMGGYCANEKDVNLKLALILGELLKSRNVQVFYTRTDDRFIELTERRDMAMRLGVDLFISIHTNSTPQRPQAYLSGPEVYYYFKRDKNLAEAIWRNMSKCTGIQGRGHLFSRFCVIMNEKVPSVLVEAAYLNNMNDIAALVKPGSEYCQMAMLGVADGISDVFGLQKSPPPPAGATIETEKLTPIIPSENRFGKKMSSLLEEPVIDRSNDQLPSRTTNGSESPRPDVKNENAKPEKRAQTFTPPDKKSSSWKQILVLEDEQGGENGDTSIVGEDVLSVDENLLITEEDEKGEQILDKKELKKRKKNIFKMY